LSIKIVTYQNDNAALWNAFIKQSVNGTFLLERDFMDYHKDRFQDASLLIYKDDVLLACVPGNTVKDSFYSHQGLTYGGVFIKNDLSSEMLQEVIKELIKYLQNTFHAIEFRWQPQIYNVRHDEVLRFFNNYGFTTIDTLNNLHLDYQQSPKISSKKTAGYRNGKFDELRLEINHDFESFWNQVLIPQLNSRHDAKPVHSIAEMELLASRFPDSIKQYLIYESEQLLAGVTFFKKGTIVKSQYAAATVPGMKKSALDFLYLEAIRDFKGQGFNYIDYGHVNHPDGSVNRGLQRFKEELGAVNQTVYRSQWTKN